MSLDDHSQILQLTCAAVPILNDELTAGSGLPFSFRADSASGGRPFASHNNQAKDFLSRTDEDIIPRVRCLDIAMVMWQRVSSTPAGGHTANCRQVLNSRGIKRFLTWRLPDSAVTLGSIRLLGPIPS